MRATSRASAAIASADLALAPGFLALVAPPVRRGRPPAGQVPGLVLLHPGAEQLARDVVPPRQLVQAHAAQVLLDELPLELDRVGSVPGHPLVPRGPLSLPHLATRSRPAAGGQSSSSLHFCPVRN